MRRHLLHTVPALVLLSSVFGWTTAQAQDLHRAIRAGDKDRVIHLLDVAPHLVNHKDDEGRYPLHIAAETGQVETLQLLFQQEAVLDATDNTGATALHHAARQNHDGAVALLLAAGANVNAQTQRGKTPLHLTDAPAVIRALLRAGADPHIDDAFGRTPPEFLLNYALRFAALRPAKNEALTTYIEEGIDFPVTGEAGRYTLHTAALIGHHALLDTLLARGADTRVRNDNGGTLLHSMAMGGLTERLPDLIASGADVDATNRYGLTPLVVAAMEGHSDAVGHLLTVGAVPIHRAPDGKTAAAYAADFGHPAIVDQLRAAGLEPEEQSFTALRGPYLGQPAPSEIPALFAEGVMSTVHFDHSAPSFSSDGTEVYWSPAYTSRGDYILSMRTVDGRWTTPTILPFCEVGVTYMYGTLAPDDSTLFFTSNQALDGDGVGTEMNVWFVEREGEQWGEPQYIGFDIGHEYGLSVAADGTLYLGVWDYEQQDANLYRSRLVDGAYTKPEPLPEPINTPHIEDEPHIAPDGSYLMFSSTRPDSYERSGMFISFAQPDGTWSAPQNIAPFLSMNGLVRFPAISRDGDYLFFASNQNGNWDIYWASAQILAELESRFAR